MATKTRGRTERFVLNEKFIFGAPRCIKCGRVLSRGEMIVCDNCKRRLGRRF